LPKQGHKALVEHWVTGWNSTRWSIPCHFMLRHSAWRVSCFEHTELFTMTSMDSSCGWGVSRHECIQSHRTSSPTLEMWPHRPSVKMAFARTLLPCEVENKVYLVTVVSQQSRDGNLRQLPAFGSRSPTWAVASLASESDYELFNSNNVSIHYWSWNYRGCWHQTCPPIVTHCSVWISSIAQSLTSIRSQTCYFSSLPPQGFGIGQFTRLLPALAVGAVSQAPSPESNPDSLLPVIAMVSHCLTINSW